MLLGLLERPLSKENFAVPLLPVMTSSTNRVDVEVLSSDIYHSIKEILQRAHSLCQKGISDICRYLNSCMHVCMAYVAINKWWQDRLQVLQPHYYWGRVRVRVVQCCPLTFTVWIGSAAALRLDGTWGPGSQGGTAGMSDGGFVWLAQSSRIQAVG